MHTRHAKNVPGDFYVEDGCCTSCDIPFQEAPGHFEYDSDGHCFVCTQPSTPEEVDRMVSAVWASEVSCIRYAGNDSGTLEKLIAVKEQDRCDV